MKFKLKALWLADPVPLDVLEVLESFLIPLLDLKIEGQELFKANQRLVCVRMHYNMLEYKVSMALIRTKTSKKDARLHLLGQNFMILHCIKPESWYTFFFCKEAL